MKSIKWPFVTCYYHCFKFKLHVIVSILIIASATKIQLINCNTIQVASNASFPTTENSSSIQANSTTSHDLNHDQESYICNPDEKVKVPIFIIKQTICNFDGIPVEFYTITLNGASPDSRYINCLQGDLQEKFCITDQNVIQLREKIDQSVVNLDVMNAKITSDKPNDYKREVENGIHFTLDIKDCGQEIRWQTILVAILASLCVVLISSMAIMYILYQQKLASSKLTLDDDYRDEMARGKSEETFINPRRTSSYDFNTMTKPVGSSTDMKDIPEE